MADSVDYARLLNPWVLHLQKMGLELKCPSCLNLLNRPLLLPCNHIFCRSCIPTSSGFKFTCLVCRSPYDEQDLRPTPHIENIVSIFSTMETTFSLNLFTSRSKSDSRERHSGNEDQNQGVALNQVTQPSPDSPPSFGEPKDSDYESSDHGAKRRAQDLLTKAIQNGLEGGISTKWYSGSGSTPQEVDCKEGPKRRKLNVVGNSVNAHPTCFNNNDMFMPKSEGGDTSVLPFAPPSSTLKCSNANPSYICGLCQSSMLSELSGPMLHYVNGEEVSADKLPPTNVVHVHRKCILWAPRVYYVGEKVVGLDDEIARGAKLKCSSCGIKGATLGCYVKSCRKNYHAPCAGAVEDSRWDCENFLMLCPAHASKKFPSERSKSAKNHLADTSGTTEMKDGQSNVWTMSPVTSQWVLCGSALSGEEKELVAKFASLSGATVSKLWRPEVTHVIASTNGLGACSRTLKVLMAILNGKWILNINWIKASMAKRAPMREEPYEVNLDIHGCKDGPKNGRLRVTSKAPKLFSGINIYFSGEFIESYKGYLEDLVVAAGGRLLTKDILVSQVPVPGTENLILYNLDPSHTSRTEEVSIVMERSRGEAEALGAQTGSRVIDQTWLLASIAACKLQPVIRD